MKQVLYTVPIILVHYIIIGNSTDSKLVDVGPEAEAHVLDNTSDYTVSFISILHAFPKILDTNSELVDIRTEANIGTSDLLCGALYCISYNVGTDNINSELVNVRPEANNIDIDGTSDLHVYCTLYIAFPTM